LRVRLWHRHDGCGRRRGRRHLRDPERGQHRLRRRGQRLRGTGLTSFEQLLARTTDHGGFAIVTVDANTALWLMGVSSGQLHDWNFALS
ncbi:MAG TPA: hypothetical protein VHL79_03525, partial [Ramlibacter sp.]|nr:hypothetical protein [Ramlibacter sp.]